MSKTYGRRCTKLMILRTFYLFQGISCVESSGFKLFFFINHKGLLMPPTIYCIMPIICQHYKQIITFSMRNNLWEFWNLLSFLKRHDHKLSIVVAFCAEKVLVLFDSQKLHLSQYYIWFVRMASWGSERNSLSFARILWLYLRQIEIYII